VLATAGTEVTMLFGNHAMEIQTQTSNKDALLKALKNLGATNAIVNYSGSGDSGDSTEISVTPKRAMNKPSAAKVTIQRVEGKYIDGHWQQSIQDKEVPLEEAIGDFAMQWVDLHHGGWENNDGGSGTFEIVVKSGEFLLEHREYYTEVNTHVYHL
jgi:hypothetical protein